MEGVVFAFDEGENKVGGAVGSFLDGFLAVEDQFDLGVVGCGRGDDGGDLNAEGVGIFVAAEQGFFVRPEGLRWRDRITACTDLDFGLSAFAEVFERVFDGGFEGVLEQSVDGGEGDTERGFAAVGFVGSSEALVVEEEVGFAAVACVGGDIDLELKAIGLGFKVIGRAEQLVVGGCVDHNGGC